MSGTIQQLRDQLLCSDERGRTFALQQLACTSSEGVNVIRQALQCSEKVVALSIARAMVEIDFPERFDVLVEMLASPNLLIAELSARVLERYGERAVAPLLATLPDCHAFVQVGIVATLERIGSRSVVKALMELLRKTEYTTLRYMIIQALGSLGDPGALELVCSFSDDPDYYVRERTRVAIRQLSATGFGGSQK